MTQGAYTERRSTLTNRGVTPLFAYIGTGNRIGKFYPRGCRGFIKDIELYCQCTVVEDGEFTLYLAPYPTAGYIYEANIELSNPTAAAWQSAVFNIFWNYDSLFIFMKSEEDSMLYGYDAETLPDGYQSDNAGRTYTNWANRLWSRVNYLGQTVGDLPVSGTVNTINIPNMFSGHDIGLTTEVDGGSSVVILDTVYGVGSLDAFMVDIHKTSGGTTWTDMEIRITIDGVVHIFDIFHLECLVGNISLTYSPVSFMFIDDVTEAHAFAINYKIGFHQSLKIELYNVGGIGDKMKAYYLYSYSILR